MPKDKSSRASAPQIDRCHPYKPCGKGSEGDSAEECAGTKNWEDAVCPICLEFPHNAVLLLCASHEKGCRPYICNTSYRHSNCLDQYQKAQAGLQKPQGPRQLVLDANQRSRQPILEAAPIGEPLELRIVDADSALVTRRLARRFANAATHGSDHAGMDSVIDEAMSLRITNANSVVATRRSRRTVPVPASRGTAAAEMHFSDLEASTVGEVEGLEEPVAGEHSAGSSSLARGDIKDLVCPLCRGKVNGWQVIDAARKHLNDKARSCSQESCVFAGTYEELRAHARCDHPYARPSEVDPARQLDWRRLERQRDLGDVLSSIRSAMPGATVFGDYVIEDDLEIENEDIDFPGDDGHWWRVFFLFQIFGPAASGASGGGISSRIRGHQQRQQRRAGSARLRQLVENLHRGNNEANSAAGNSVAGEQTAETAHRRQRNQRRHQGDVS